MGRKGEVTLLSISIGGYALMAVSFMLMPLETQTNYTGAMFWVMLMLGIAGQVALDIKRKMFFKRFRVNYRKTQKRFCGAFAFFSNLPAKIADIAFPVSLVGMILSFWLTRGVGYSCYVFISLTVFSLAAHCIFNGRNFFFVLNKRKIYTILEQKRKSKMSKGEEKRQ